MVHIKNKEGVDTVEVVEINNELRELEYAERREIVRRPSRSSPDLLSASRCGADGSGRFSPRSMLRAKGALRASENGCVKPIVWTEQAL